MVNVPLFTTVQDGTAFEADSTSCASRSAGDRRRLGWFADVAPRADEGRSAGLICAGVGFLGLSRWDADPGLLLMTAPLFIAGLGFGLVIAPVNTVVLDASEEDDRATMAALLTVMRLVGALVGVALLTTRGLSGFYTSAGQVDITDPNFIDRVIGLEVDSFRSGFVVTAAVCFVALIPCGGSRSVRPRFVRLENGLLPCDSCMLQLVVVQPTTGVALPPQVRTGYARLGSSARWVMILQWLKKRSPVPAPYP